MKKLCLALMVLLMACMGTVPVFAAGIEDTAEELAFGTAQSGYFDDDWNVDFSITVQEKGTVTFTVKTECYYTSIELYDTNGNTVTMGEAKAATGKADKYGLTWNDTVEKAEGTFTYQLNKGTYYLRCREGGGISRRSNSDKVSVTASFKSSTKANTATSNAASTSTDKAPATYLSLTLKKGSQIKLGAMILHATDKTTTWTSSKENVATVNGGTIKAIEKGTSLITVTANKKSDYIYIIVE